MITAAILLVAHFIGSPFRFFIVCKNAVTFLLFLKHSCPVAQAGLEFTIQLRFVAVFLLQSSECRVIGMNYPLP